MSGSTITPNMGMTLPTVGITNGPLWATNVNSCISIIDSHNHTSGLGAKIPSAGININADLSFYNNNATTLRSVRLSSQSSLLSGASDKGCIYQSSTGDLYFNNGSGTQIPITANGAVAGTPGNIASLTSPASASYVAGSQKFVWQSGTNIPASMDGGSVILRNISAGSYGYTLNPPSSMGSDYSATLPTTPGASKIMTMDGSGAMSASTDVDNVTIQIASGLIKLASQYILPPGMITAYGDNTAPTGWLLCDGTSYLRASYPVLYAIIGTYYGTADSTHFNVPDFRGRFLRGRDAGAGRDPDAGSRTAMNSGGSTGDQIGSIQGSAFTSHTHTQNPHFHTVQTASGTGAAANVLPQGNNPNTSTAQTTTETATNQNTGGSETRPINAYVYYIIKT